MNKYKEPQPVDEQTLEALKPAFMRDAFDFIEEWMDKDPKFDNAEARKGFNYIRKEAERRKYQ